MTTPYSTGPGLNGYPAQVPQQSGVPAPSRGKALGAACRGFGITGLVIFALVILGTLVNVLIPSGEHWLDLLRSASSSWPNSSPSPSSR